MKRTNDSASVRTTLLLPRHKKSKTEDPQGDQSSESHIAIENQDLWDRAYKQLRDGKESRKLIEAYEKVLSTEIGNDKGSLAGLTGSSLEKQMSVLVGKKLQDVEDARWKFQLGDRTVEIRAQLDRLIKAVLFAKDFVSSAANTDPHAGLAWAGVAMLLPLLQNPTLQQSTLMEGVEYVSTLIVRFTVIERNCRRREPWIKSSNPGDTSELNTAFETQVTKLYSQILCYEARVVCQMVRPSLLRYGRDVFKLDDWSTLLNNVKASEAACTLISQVVDSEKLDAAQKDVDRMLNDLLCTLAWRFDALQQIAEQTLAGVKQHRTEQKYWHRTDEESDCLKALCTSTYEDYKNRNPPRVHGTCQWFLDHQRFHDWLRRDSSDLLWVTADPGCGKSVLSRSLIDGELHSCRSITTAYFFFKDIGDQRSATTALCALLHQLCTQNQAVLQETVDIYRGNGKQMTQSFSWLWSTYLAVSQCPAAGEIVCVLDALDECEEQGKKDLIDSLNSFYHTKRNVKGRVKFLVTSRPYFNIEELFDQRVIRLTGEDESEQIRKEIDLVIKDRVPAIASQKKLDLNTQNYFQERLLSTENRTYLWLYLTLADIEKALGVSTPKRMKQIIDKIPRTVDDAYEAMLDRSPCPEKARRLLHIVLAAVRPLTLREMNMALNIEKGQRSREEVDLDPEETFPSYLKNLCGLFVSVYDSRIYLLHQTAKEFLMLSESSSALGTCHNLSTSGWKSSMELDVSNSMLAEICLTYLSFAVFEDDPLVYESDTSWPRSPYASENVIAEYCLKHDSLDYASKNWASHFRHVREDSDMSTLWHYICDPLSHRFVTWTSCTRDRGLYEDTAPLNLASYLGHDAIVEQVIRPDVNLEECYNQYHSTPLSRAACSGYEKIVGILIQKGACMDARDDNGCTPLMRAARNGHEAVMRVLLSVKADVNGSGMYELTPLNSAVLGGYEVAVNLLLEAGAPINSLDKSGQTSLHVACKNRHEAMVRLLLEAGALINSLDRSGRTSLHAACTNRHEAMVRLLLEAGADPNIADRDGQTPLHCATICPGPNRIDGIGVAQLLLGGGAPINILDRSGQTSLHAACADGREAMVRLLLEAGADPNIADRDGQTPLHCTTICSGLNRIDGIGLAQLLPEEGAPINILDRSGQTSLHAACMNGHEAILRLLLEAGAPINSLDRSGRTSLHAACTNGHEAMVRFLLESGADPNIEDEYLERAIDIARRGGGGRLSWPRKNWQTIVGLLEPITEDPYSKYCDEYESVEDEESQLIDDWAFNCSDHEFEATDTLKRAPRSL